MKSLLFVICFFVSSQVFAETYRWCAYFNWPPWIYKTQQSNYRGILIDQLNLFEARNPDVSLKVKDIDSWKRCQQSVASGQTDFILGANKTPERTAKLLYLDRPSFINKTGLGAYTSFYSTVPNQLSLNDLVGYKLAVSRGNSYGAEIDAFVSTLTVNKNIVDLSTIDQVMKFVASNRADYFFMPTSTFKVQLEVLNEGISVQRQPYKFRKIFEFDRATPVYIAFSRHTDAYSELMQKWLDVLDEYYQSVDFSARVDFHQAQLKLANP